jgi:hypothetical protein
MTVPFGLNDRTTLIRARVDHTGSIEHLLPPVFHNDPLSLGGILCFQVFGWDLLDLLRDLGCSTFLLVARPSLPGGGGNL